MSSITLAQAKLLGLDDLGASVSETIVTVNPVFNVLPFNTTVGNAYVYNRELAMGDVQVLGIDGTITAKAQATVAQKTQALTTIIGDAEVNQLIEAQGVGTTAGNDPVTYAVASKAKAIGRKYQDLMVNGDSANANEFDGLVKLLNSSDFASQKLATAALTLEYMDELLGQVKSKGNTVDFLMGNLAVENKLKALARALNGSALEWVMSPAGRFMVFNGVPFYRNDWLAAADADGVTAGTQNYIFAGNFDDGSRAVGISGVMPTAGGIQVKDIGESETKDNRIIRVKMYGTFAAHSVLGLAGGLVTL
jgi:hypothetical protein